MYLATATYAINNENDSKLLVTLIHNAKPRYVET